MWPSSTLGVIFSTPAVELHLPWSNLVIAAFGDHVSTKPSGEWDYTDAESSAVTAEGTSPLDILHSCVECSFPLTRCCGISRPKQQGGPNDCRCSPRDLSGGAACGARAWRRFPTWPKRDWKSSSKPAPGLEAGYPDADYASKGAKIVASRGGRFRRRRHYRAGAVLRLQRSHRAGTTFPLLRRGQVLIGFLRPLGDVRRPCRRSPPPA